MRQRSGERVPRVSARGVYAEVDTAGAASALVEQKVSLMPGLDRETAHYQLTAMLSRRGFSSAEIRSAVRRAVSGLPMAARPKVKRSHESRP